MEYAAEIFTKRARLTEFEPREMVTFDLPRSSICEVDYTVIKSMSRFYMLLRYLRERNHFDLNTTTNNYEDCPHFCNCEEEPRRCFAKTPWQLGDDWHVFALINKGGVSVIDASSSTM
jgi:hypothetical protein